MAHNVDIKLGGIVKNQITLIWKSDNGFGKEGFQSALYYKEVGRFGNTTQYECLECK